MKEKKTLVTFDLLSVFIFQGTGIQQWRPHPVNTRCLLSRHYQLLPWPAHSKSDIWSSLRTCRSTGYNVLSFRISSRSLPTSVLFCPQLLLFFNVHIKQSEIQKVNKSANSCRFLSEISDKAADSCCIHKPTVKISRLCLPSQEQSYWSTVDFNDSHSFQDKFPRPVRFAATLFCQG